MTILIWIVSLVIGGVGLYNSITSDTALLNIRVRAIENRNEKLDPLIERFYVTEQNEKQTKDVIKEVKESVKRIEEKVDRILLNVNERK